MSENTVNNGFVKIKKNCLSPGEYDDVSDMGIVYDSNTGEYRRKIKCVDCGCLIGCFCFNTLSEVICTENATASLCGRCYIKNESDEYVSDIMDDLFPGRSVDELTDLEVDEIMERVSELIEPINCDFDGWVCSV